jgi:hypothetical protein
MELFAHFTSQELVVSLAIYLVGVVSGVLLAWASRVRDGSDR